MNGADRRKKLGVLALVLGLGTLILFPGALFRGESFFERDIQAYYRPAKSLLVPLSRSSSGLPLWNPLFASGQPFAANPEHELFHPLTALFFLLPFEWAFRLQIILPVLGAALSMFFLLDSFGLGFESATLGALAWGFGGYTLSTTNLLPILFAIAVLPAALAFAVRLVTHGGPWNLAGLGLMIGLECLAGEPSTLLMTALLLPASLLAPGDDRAARLRRSVPRLVLGLALGGALGAVTLIPGLHHVSKTVRAGGLPDRIADRWSLPPIRLLELVAPRVLGHLDQPDERWYWGGKLYPERNYPFLYSIYPGLIVALLSGAALTRGPPGRLVWVGLAVLGALLAVGTHLPLWHLARSVVPGLKGLRYAEKFILLTVFSIVVLSSLAFEELQRDQTNLRRRLVWSLGLVGFLATFAGLILLGLDVLRGNRLWVSWGISPAIATSWASVAGGDGIRIGATAAVGLAVLVFFRRAVWLLIAVAAADLVLTGRPLVPTKPSAVLSSVPPVLSPLVRGNPPGPLFHFAAWDQNLGTTTGLCKPPVPAQWGIATTLEEDFDLTELRWSHRATRMFFETVRTDPSLFSPLLRRRGVAAVLRLRPELSGTAGGVGKRLPVGSEGPLSLLSTRDPSAFVFCASRLVPGDGEKGWQDAVKSLGRDAATAAVVDPHDLVPFPGEVSEGRVESILVNPGRVEFDVTANGPKPAFVAVNQTWDEGWSARVNGDPARLVRTDLSLSGLLVPPGRHHVSLSYADPWVTGGLAISLAALAAILVLLVAGGTGRGRPLSP